MFFFHSENAGANNRRVCVAAEVTQDGELSFGVATCSKQDQYTRKIGRAIASGRAAKRPVVIIPLVNRDAYKVFMAQAPQIAKEQIARFKK